MLGARLRSPRLWRPPLSFRSPLGGVRGRRPSGQPPAAHGPGWGKGGGGGLGGEGGVPHSPPLVPWCRPPTAAWGPAADWGGQTLVQALARAPCSPRCRRVVPAGRRGGGVRACECWGRRFGSAVSGYRAAGQWASPFTRCPRPFSRWRWHAPLSRAVQWGGCGSGGPAPLGRDVPRHCPLPTLSRSLPGRAGRGRHLRRRLCRGWGCGGGGFSPQ